MPQTAPNDEHNRELVEQVHPQDWTNPTPAVSYSVAVVGCGTAGLVTAAGAAKRQLSSDTWLSTRGFVCGCQLGPFKPAGWSAMIGSVASRSKAS
ncbi:hypothetical protein OAG71_00105 [bacterium]|nr:hypothetical protein [bacterium]